MSSIDALVIAQTLDKPTQALTIGDVCWRGCHGYSYSDGEYVAPVPGLIGGSVLLKLKCSFRN